MRIKNRRERSERRFFMRAEENYTIMEAKRTPRHYTAEFKQQMVDLHNNGKGVSDIAREYDIPRSALNSWIKRINATGSAAAKDNLTPEQLEIKQLHRENQRLQMENDILKQAALIFGRK